MSSSLVFCLFVVMTTVYYSYGQCTTKYCEEGEEGLNKNLMEQIQYLFQENSRMREIAATQQQQHASLQAKLSELENKLTQVESQKTGVQATQQLQQQYTSLQAKLNQLETKQTGIQNEMNKARSLTAFHVYMDKGGYIYPNSGDVIPFNTVITNIGGGFSTTTHKFRCPVSGVYAFWFTLWTGALPFGGKRYTGGDLMMDGTVLSRAWCQNEGSDIVYMMCSNQAVTECQAGSHVWVQIGWSGVTLYGGPWRQTTFSGFLLKQN